MTTTSTASHEPLEALAARLIGRPVYALLRTEGADFGGEHIAGLYGRRLDLRAREWLTNQNRWIGRQPAVFVDDTRHDTERDVVATMVHELAHLLDIGPDDTPEDSVHPAEFALLRLAHNSTKDLPTTPVARCPLHGPRFARAAVHLWWRAFQAGHWFSPNDLWEGQLYGIPEPPAVMRALDGEFERLAELPVELIVSLPVLNPAFLELMSDAPNT